jgi:hypothetical protein
MAGDSNAGLLLERVPQIPWGTLFPSCGAHGARLRGHVRWICTRTCETAVLHTRGEGTHAVQESLVEILIHAFRNFSYATHAQIAAIGFDIRSAGQQYS